MEDHSWSTCKNSHQSDTKVKCAVMFVLLPGQVEVRVGSLAVVAFPARRGGVERREYGARGGGGAPPGLRGGEAVSAAQTLMEKGSLHSRCMFYTQAEDAGRVTGITLKSGEYLFIPAMLRLTTALHTAGLALRRTHTFAKARQFSLIQSNQIQYQIKHSEIC